MRESWLNHVLTDTREEFKNKIKANKEAWLLLAEVLENRIQVYNPNYDEHSWAYRQADQNGYNKALREIIDLLRSV